MIELVNKRYTTRQEIRLRKQMIAAGMVDAIIKVGRGFLYHNSPATTIIINKNKANQNNDTVLFVDARAYTKGVNSFLREWKQRNVFALVALHQNDFTPFEELKHDYEDFFGFSFSDIGDVEITIASNIEIRQDTASGIAFEKNRREMAEAEKERIKKLETMADEAKWLSDNCGDGQYHDIPGFCKEVKTKDLLTDEASIDPKDYVNDSMVS